MTDLLLPQVIVNYIDASNAHDAKAYMNTFSYQAVIKEESIGRDLAGQTEIENYFVTYFVKMNTRTEIMSYSIQNHVVDMRVLFKGDFPGREIIGTYQFHVHNDKIEQLTADLE